MMEKIDAPWRTEQVTSINAFQASNAMHPFTCPFRGLADPVHRDWGEGDVGVLLANEGGLFCRDCSYQQGWVWDVMAEWDVDQNKFLLPDGRVLTTHPAWRCEGEYCCVHNPSNHHMRTWDLNWRDDRGRMERLCPHGIGHPDPDALAFRARNGMNADDVHGCDGCCHAA